MAGTGAYHDQTREGKIKGGGTRRAVEWRLHKGCSSTPQKRVCAGREVNVMATLGLLRAVYDSVRLSSPAEVPVRHVSGVKFRRFEASGATRTRVQLSSRTGHRGRSGLP